MNTKSSAPPAYRPNTEEKVIRYAFEESDTFDFVVVHQAQGNQLIVRAKNVLTKQTYQAALGEEHFTANTQQNLKVISRLLVTALQNETVQGVQVLRSTSGELIIHLNWLSDQTESSIW